MNDCTRMTYQEWLETDENDWMRYPDFFRGIPLDTEDAPITEVMREAIYAYIQDTFGERLISLSNYKRWGKLYRARLTSINGSFWKQYQMDMLLKIKDMVTADYSEYLQQYGKSSSSQLNQNTSILSSNGQSHAAGKEHVNPVTSTVTDTTKEGDVITSETPTKASQNIMLTSALAESTYVGEDIPGSANVSSNGMPGIDTSHGDTVGSTWSISEAKTTIVSKGAPSGKLEQVQGETDSKYEDVNSNATSSSNAGTNITNAISGNVAGTQREGHRDYNGYNLTASINAVQALLPYEFLYQALSPLFSGVMMECDYYGS